MCELEIIEILKRRLAKKRVEHIIDVADTAENISRDIYNEYQAINKDKSVDLTEESLIKRVRQAALLHDLAKDLSIGELHNISNLITDEWLIDEEELAIHQVLHAPVSAHLAKHELGIADYEVLEAIRFHTIGSPDMGMIAQIIFIADFIEPNRDFLAAEEARHEYNKNGLESAIIVICDYNIKYNIDRRKQVHPNTVILRNAYLRRQN